jgi:hypothetical protein
MCLICVEYAAERMSRSEVERALAEIMWLTPGPTDPHVHEIVEVLTSDYYEELAELPIPGEESTYDDEHSQAFPLPGGTSTTGGGTASTGGELG